LNKDEGFTIALQVQTTGVFENDDACLRWGSRQRIANLRLPLNFFNREANRQSPVIRTGGGRNQCENSNVACSKVAVHAQLYGGSAFQLASQSSHEITGIDYDPALAEAALGSEPNRSAAYVLMASRMVETLRAAIGTLQMREPMELSNIQDMELIAEGLLIDLNSAVSTSEDSNQQVCRAERWLHAGQKLVKTQRLARGRIWRKHDYR